MATHLANSTVCLSWALLADEQIEAIRRWVQAGAPEGDPQDLPPTPTFTEGWQLGQPDLVIEMDQPFTLAGDGTDVFRNFVIPIPVGTTKFVRAVELRPGNKQVVHHANMLIDRTPSSRRMDAQDPEPGFPGMEMFGEAEIPEGHFLNWKPGTPPFAGIDGKAWRLDKGTDMIVNLHMLPSGKSELVAALINWGSVLAKQQKFAEAEELYRRALGIDPRSAESLDNLGLIYALRGQIDRAMELFQQALNVDPDHVGAHMNSAKVAAQRNQLDQSAQHCRHVIRIDPTHAEAYNQLGAVLVQQGKLDEAEAQFQRALELEPNNALARKRLATVRARLRGRP